MFSPEKKPLPIFLKIARKCKTLQMKEIVYKHLSTILKYEVLVQKYKEKAFSTREEYEAYADARFFLDVCCRDDEPEPAAEGEMDSFLSSENKTELESFLRKFPPLDAFYMSPIEKLAKRNNFWKNIREGDIVNAQIISKNTEEYDLLLVNKHQETERLIDLSIKACMNKGDTNEFLIPGHFIRAVTVAYKKFSDTDISLMVTVNPAAHGLKNAKIELGRIEEDAIPFPPINVNNYSSFAHFIESHPSCKDTKEILKKLPLIDIDPYKAYSFFPELDGKKSEVVVEEDASDAQKRTVSEMMQKALFHLSFRDFQKAMEYVNEVLKLCPDYSDAYVLRGRVYLGMAQNKPCGLVKLASSEFKQALMKSYGYNQSAIDEYANLRIASARRFIKDGDYLKAKKNLVNVVNLGGNQTATELLMIVESKLTKSTETPTTLEIA